MTNHIETPVLLVGQSHLGVFGVHRQRSTALTDDPEFVLKTIKVEPHPVYALSALVPYQSTHDQLCLEAIGEHGRGKTLVLLWQGGFFYAKFTVIDRPGFDFFLKSDPNISVDFGRQIVPEALVEQSLQPATGNLRHILTMINQLGDCGPARIVVAATPPPKNDIAFITERISLEFGDDVVEKINGEQYQLCPPDVMLKIWRKQMQLNAIVATEQGADFLHFPPSCVDENGFLNRKFYGSDVTHANLAWSEIFLDHLFSHLENEG